MFLSSPYLLPTFPPSVHFPIIPSFLIHNLYKYNLQLYIAFGSAKNWLTWALHEGSGIRREEKILMFFLLACVLYIIYAVQLV